MVPRSLVAQRVEEECVHDAQRVCSAELQHTFSHGIAGPKAVKTEYRIRLFSRPCVANTTIEVTQNASGPGGLMETTRQRCPEAKNVDLLSAKGRPADADNGPPSFVAVKLQRA